MHGDYASDMGGTPLIGGSRIKTNSGWRHFCLPVYFNHALPQMIWRLQ